MSNVGSSIVRDWASVAESLIECVEVEFTVFKPKIANGTRWHQPALDVTGLLIATLANVDIWLPRELLFQSFLLVFLIRTERLTDISVVELAVFLLRK